MIQARLQTMDPGLIVRLWRHIVEHLVRYLVFEPL